MSDAQEFTYRRLLPSCRLVVTIMACISFLSGLSSCYLFMTEPTKVSQAVRIVWTTAAAIYSFSALLLIIGVWKLIKWLGYLYMCLLLVAIAVYTEILFTLLKNLPASVFLSVAISFIFLGLALNITKIIGERQRQAARET